MTDEAAPRYSTMIRDLPQSERPRERLKGLGPSALSNGELIAILLRTGVSGESVLDLSTRLVSRLGGLPGIARTSYDELCAINGISEAKACQLLAAFELGRRLVSMSPEERAVIRSPRDVANLVSAEMGYLDQEHLRVLALSSKNEVLGIDVVYVGNVGSAIVRVAEVVRPAVRRNCPAIIIVHNHPSGDPTPSDDDVLVTRRLVTGAEMVDVDVLDHVVIGGQNFVSMKDKGLGFRKSGGE